MKKKNIQFEYKHNTCDVMKDRPGEQIPPTEFRRGLLTYAKPNTLGYPRISCL